MDELAGSTALLTGAAGGLGRHLARALAAEGVRLVVSGRNLDALEDLCGELIARGAAAEPLVADLADPDEAAELVERAEELVGPLDLLVSNAGVELVAAYSSYTDEELARVAQVNLLSPMILARHALPGMLRRRRGHVVVTSSLAGRGGNAYNVLYAMTKAGLLGFGRSLRAELEHSPVGLSVICPGLIAGDGMYAEFQKAGVDAPLALRPVAPERVARAVVDAIAQDRPDVLVTAWPMRPLLAIQELAPRAAERIVRALGAQQFFATVAQATGRTASHAPERTSASR